MKKIPKKIISVVLKVITGVMTAALFAAVCFVLIMAHPQPDKEKSSDPQPLLTASPAITASSPEDLMTLIKSFPTKVMAFSGDSGMTFLTASSEDFSVSGGTARIATLWWQDADGEQVILQSIYPSTALSLLEDGYRFSPTGGPMLFGSQSVRMEKADTVRIHAAVDTGLYVMIVPKSLGSQVAALSRSLQIISYPD